MEKQSKQKKKTVGKPVKKGDLAFIDEGLSFLLKPSKKKKND
tara:strand:+ start:128 stop:253 length:126 start_codon:yes stop_codon:yes gene_type:complete